MALYGRSPALAEAYATVKLSLVQPAAQPVPNEFARQRIAELRHTIEQWAKAQQEATPPEHRAADPA